EKIRIRFTPKPELYAKANDAIRLLRELGRLGEMEVTCDTSAVVAGRTTQRAPPLYRRRASTR
ncbi:MAG: hypothetical protein F9K43_03895, partial [Bauldia sp.]